MLIDDDGERAWNKAAEYLLLSFLTRNWFVEGHGPIPTEAEVAMIDKYVEHALFYGIASTVQDMAEGTDDERFEIVRDEIIEASKGFDPAVDEKVLADLLDRLIVRIKAHWAKVRAERQVA